MKKTYCPRKIKTGKIKKEICGLIDNAPSLDKIKGEKANLGSFSDCIMLAHAYVPWQTYKQAFCPPEALMKGTLFPELWGAYKIPK